jgi:hypothetical protein
MPPHFSDSPFSLPANYQHRRVILKHQSVFGSLKEDSTLGLRFCRLKGGGLWNLHSHFKFLMWFWKEEIHDCVIGQEDVGWGG